MTPSPIIYPEEHRTFNERKDTIMKIQLLAECPRCHKILHYESESSGRLLQKARRETPYPACTALCPVTDAWGPQECRKLCPEKFKPQEV